MGAELHTDTIDTSTLFWVKAEIDATLKQARVALESFVEEPEDEASQLEFCTHSLHEVAGSLKLVDLTGPAMLAEELEALGGAIARGALEQPQPAYDVLMRGILQLPDYLEALQLGQPDNPLLLLPLLDESRSVRGAGAFPAEEFFRPDLTVTPPAPAKPVRADVRAAADKLRRFYQASLLNVMRARDLDHSLRTMAAVIDKLDPALTEPGVRRTLWILGGVLEALQQDGLPLEPKLKQLLGKGDQLLRELESGGEQAVQSTTWEPIERAMLWQLARARSSGSRVSTLRDVFGLEALVPEGGAGGGSLGGVTTDVKKTVARDILEELAWVKESLDVFVRAEQQSADELRPISESLERLSHTLGMLDQEVLQSSLLSQNEIIRAILDGEREADEQTLMDIASVVLIVESALADWGSFEPVEQADEQESQLSGEETSPQAEAEHQRVIRQVMKEAKDELVWVKDDINNHVAEPGDGAHLHNTAARLHAIIGSLSMLSYTRAAQILRACDRYLAEQMMGGRPLPDQDALDALADAVTGIEYYLESFVENRVHPTSALAVAEAGVATLGYPVDALAAAGAAEEPAGTTAPDESPSTAAEPGEAPSAEESAPEGATAPAETPEQEAPAPEATPEPARDTAAPEAGQESEAPGEAAPPEAPAEEAPASEPAAALSSELEDIDPEILEIFIEEANEELEKLAELFPRWQADTADEEALLDLRRSYHTLKGSGRLVGAATIGEFAWAFENMLNRVIDNTVKPTPAMFDLIDQSRYALREMVDHLQGGTAPATDVEELQTFAHAFSKPGGLDELLAASKPSQPAEPEPAAEAEPPAEPEAAAETAAGDTEIPAPELDAVLRDIYEKESASHLSAIDEFIAACRDHARCRVSAELIRALHTLQGSSRMAGITPVAEVARSLEQYAKILQSERKPISDAARDLLGEFRDYIDSVLQRLHAEAATLPSHTHLLARCDELYEGVRHLSEGLHPESGLRGESSDPAAAAEEVRADAPQAEAQTSAADATLEPGPETDAGPADSGAPEPYEADAAELEAAFAEDASDAGPVESPVAAESLETETVSESPAPQEVVTESGTPAPEAGASDHADSDPELLAIFLEEGEELLDASESTLQQWVDQPGEMALVEKLQRELHTLKGSARMAGIAAIGDLAHSLESTMEAVAERRLEPNRDVRDLLQLSHDRLAQMLEQVRAHEPVGSGDDLIADIHALGRPAPEPAAAQDPVPGSGATEPDYDPELLEIFLEEGEELLDASEHTLQAWVDEPGDASRVGELQRQLHTLKGSARMAGVTAVGDLSHGIESALEAVDEGRLPRTDALLHLLQQAHDRLSSMLEQVKAQQPVASGTDLLARLEQLGRGEDAGEVFDADAEPVAAEDVTAAFFREADSLLTESERLLETWAGTPDSEDLAERLRGELYALRDALQGRDLADATALVKGATAALTAVVDGHVAVSERSFSLLRLSLQRLRQQLEAEQSGGPRPQSDDLLSDLDDLIASGVEQQLQEAGEAEPAASEPEPKPAAPKASERRHIPRMQHELVRVRSDLLDNMVNLAGESSIYRSRVEQQMGSVGQSLDELDQTIERLREQLRRFDIETEAQIQSRYEEAVGQGHEDFDPLEFDRFTQMQTLSRGMMESLADLASIEDMLSERAREAETLLLQQGRVNTELQEGLMHTRMVQLVDHAPRLRRLVRQTSNELGRRAELRFSGSDVEMDRTVVERMLAPLEHLLRNAVAHGIETPDERRSAGKPVSGTILIRLVREGSEVVITVADDGRGISLESVREKAIAKGLMQPGADLSDKEVLSFILESGFSTAESLSQVAGRGVGMDVVNSEVKQLGGSLEIDSRYGKGTEFVVRLPFTLSVSRALLVYVDEDICAVPLLSIEGIERVEHETLEQLFEQDDPEYRWLGQEYRLMHLGEVLGVSQRTLPGAGRKLPLLLAHTGDHRVALVVEGIVGSREIVAKSLGSQLSVLRGLSGATILGDGSVALILDLPVLIRRGLAQTAQGEEEAVPGEQVRVSEREPVVMVVDDSITVRKVTTRLLERNNIKSVTAKDGVDALAVLEEVTPDVMLLDIEMPRMDGFELATHIRNSETLKDIPIIMITSRTGEKHRQRGMEIGVNIYLGKPYQEADLLENIQKLLDERGS